MSTVAIESINARIRKAVKARVDVTHPDRHELVMVVCPAGVHIWG